jgi:hypothetical protein
MTNEPLTASDETSLHELREQQSREALRAALADPDHLAGQLSAAASDHLAIAGELAAHLKGNVAASADLDRTLAELSTAMSWMLRMSRTGTTLLKTMERLAAR